ncbi:hypothetical protein NZ47_03380 [Anaerovibrio lipolyticus]|uniref:Uncharacterized protein n=1 Tax=Anaerovibrio lipolyticus TaxID=82374 RepID=A0A0B2JWF7_9FIRM|nr:hypothetical protein [Anaerovibrio lipolyticus]KHM52655.1 hypothetical protein NZ47_03380 [Anaerovibrio lipolyticus]
MDKIKYALLDTDFISKTYNIQNNDSDHLIDLIVAMPEYRFYCHEQIQKELNLHNKREVSIWLQNQIGSKVIRCFTDEEILQYLLDSLGRSGIVVYVDFLQKACEYYSKDYFIENFKKLNGIDYLDITKEKFIMALKHDCDALGNDNNLGELKSYVLIQFLMFMHDQRVYIFCSDDKKARRGMINFGIKCISVISSFMRLQKEIGFSKDEALPYINTWLGILKESGQSTFRIHNNYKEETVIRVACEKIFDEMFEGKLVELQTGELKYR